MFINKYMHIGTDEFGKDFPGFDKQKETAEKFRAFMARVMLDAWYNGYADPKEMMKLGFKINSIPDGMVYIVPAAGYYYDYLNTAWMYENWSPSRVGNCSLKRATPL